MSIKDNTTVPTQTSNSLSYLSVILQGTPTSVRSIPQWVHWKYTTDKDGKKSKPPTCADGYLTDIHKPDNWLTFQQATDGFKPKIHAGIGFVLDNSGYTGIDIDNCLKINGDASSLKSWAKPLLDQIRGNYSEISPSGEGLKVFVQGTKPNGFNRTKMSIGDGAIEIHDHQYFTVTGEVIDSGDSDTDRQAQLDSLCHYLLQQTSQQKQKPKQPNPSPVPTELPTGIDLQQRLEIARHEKGAKFASLFDQGDISQYDNDHSQADFALCQKLAFYLEKNEALIDQAFRQSKLYREDKWNYKHRGDGSTYGQMTIEKAISITTDVYKPIKAQPAIPRSAPTAFEIPKDYLMGSDHYYAEMVLKRFGQDIRWCSDMERFFVWSSGHWQISKDQKVFQKLNDLVKELKDDIFLAKDADFKDLKKLIDRASKFANIHRQRAVLDYIKRDVMIESADLDMDVYLLNFQNCTVDLRTGEQKPHDREDYITKIIPYDYNPEAKSEQWIKFINEIMGNDAEMVEYLQLAMGYACNGSTDEQSLFMLHGMGANGKSTFCEAILDALGDYGKTVADDFFVAKHQREHPTEIADLQGARLVVGSEFGGVMDEGKVKRLTGSDKLKARFMRGDMFEFAPTQTYFVCVNNKPTIRNTDDGIWRRVKLIPFTQKFSGERRDKHLPKKLKAEHEGILAWLVDGAVRSYCEGIIEPEAVTIASQEYREEFDLIGRFIDDCCDTTNPHSKIKSSRLYQAYEKWADTVGEFKHGNKQFSTELLRKGFEKAKNGCVFWHGIDLNKSYRRWDLEGLEGEMHKPQENDLYGGSDISLQTLQNDPNDEEFTPPTVSTKSTTTPEQDDKNETTSTTEVEEEVGTGGGEGLVEDAPELHIQDLLPHQLRMPVRMPEDMKHVLRDLSPFEVGHLTNGTAKVNDLWEVYQLDKEVGDKMSMQRATLYGCIIKDSLDGT